MDPSQPELKRRRIWLAGILSLLALAVILASLFAVYLNVPEALAQERRFLIILALVFCLAGSFFAILGWIVGSRFYAPLLDLSEASERFIEGDLTVRARIFGNPEIRSVGRTLNWLAAQLQKALVGEKEETVPSEIRHEEPADTIKLALAVASAADPSRSQVEMEREMLAVLLEAFKLEFAGLYRLDESGEWAELSSWSGASTLPEPFEPDLAQEGLPQEQRIHIGEGLVGGSLEQGQVRIEEGALPAEETRADGVEENSSGKKTRAAIPLQARGRRFGVLSVICAERDEFEGERLGQLQILADFLALMLANAGHPSRDRKMPSSIRPAAVRESPREEEGFPGTRPAVSYRADEHGITALPASSGVLLNEKGDRPGLSLPIQLRGRTIGSLDLQKTPGAAGFSPEEQEVLGQLVEQMSAALESARLYEETQRRAERERLAGEIIGKIRAENHPDTILRVATEELRRALKASRAQVHLHPIPPEDVSEQEQGADAEVVNPRG
jgi:GAF domain-containing protein